MRLTPERESEIRSNVERQRVCAQLIEYLWKDQHDLLQEIDALRSKRQTIPPVDNEAPSHGNEGLEAMVDLADSLVKASSGHGHVVPRADGVLARCGGPMICDQCARESAAVNKKSIEQIEKILKDGGPVWCSDVGMPYPMRD